MTRYDTIEVLRRQIYGGYVPDDATITVGLVNTWLESAIAVAAKANYKDNFQIEGIGYLNNSFYTTFKNLSVIPDEQLTWRVNLPQIPIGIGKTEGIETLKFKSTDGKVSRAAVPISSNQAAFFDKMRPIPNTLLFKPEGDYVLVKSPLLLNQWTAIVTMISGGDATDLASSVNVPADYFPAMAEYLKAQLGFERMQPVDANNDALDAVKTT